MASNSGTREEMENANNGTLQHDEIARRAYQIWDAAGRPEGMSGEHWRQAERELRSSSPSNSSPEHDFSGSESTTTAAATIEERASSSGLRADRAAVPPPEVKSSRRKRSSGENSQAAR